MLCAGCSHNTTTWLVKDHCSQQEHATAHEGIWGIRCGTQGQWERLDSTIMTNRKLSIFMHSYIMMISINRCGNKKPSAHLCCVLQQNTRLWGNHVCTNSLVFNSKPISAAILPTGSLLTICLTRCPESWVLHNSPLLNRLLLHHQGTSQTSVDHSLFPGLPSFYLLFAFRKMHRSGSLAKDWKRLGGIITSISLPHFQDELHSSCSTTHQNLQ